jgi:branched-chain amino acid aminotransferase
LADQWIFLNDRFVKKEEAVVSVYDHGFLYGDGVFEGIRMYSGNVFRLDDHIKRLYESAHSITLKIPYDQEELKQLIIETLRKNEFQDAYIRVVISRGVGDLGLSPFTCKHPGVIIIAEPLALFPKELYESGIEVVSVASRRNRSDVLDPKVKSLNYLNNILVKIEASLAGASEALMMNDQGYVAEGSGDNIFIVKDNVIKTPPGYVIREDVFTRHDVYIADEVFLTGTAAEVIAVVKVDGRNIADGQPGPVTNKLLEAFRNVVTVDGTKVYETDQIQVS